MTSTQLDFYEEREHSLMTPAMKAAISALRKGEPVLLLDAHDRENEGDLIVAAEKITSSSMNFLIQHGSGIVCLALPEARLQALEINPMVPQNTNSFKTAFTVSIEARQGITTGVSAQDRATTVKTVMTDYTRPSDLVRPGHIFPLAAKPHGVFQRMGHTEGSLDLLNLAGLKAGAVLCDLMKSDGSMAHGTECEAFARSHNITCISIEEILCHRIKTENIFEHISTPLTTRFGKLIHNRFCFFGEDYIDIFMRPETRSSYRITLLSSENMKNRFLALALDTQQDEFLEELKNLQKQSCDLIALLPQKNTKIYAALGRALLKLEIANILNNQKFPEFYSLVSNYFGINLEEQKL